MDGGRKRSLLLCVLHSNYPVQFSKRIHLNAHPLYLNVMEKKISIRLLMIYPIEEREKRGGGVGQKEKETNGFLINILSNGYNIITNTRKV